MSTEARTQPEPGYAAKPVTKAPDWHGLVAWDLLFNNLTTGLFLTAVLGDLIAPAIFTPLLKMAYPLALFFLLADLLCLILDLGDPLRFHHMLRVVKPSSPMSLGTWCLTIYSLPLTVAALVVLMPTPEADGARLALEWVRKSAVVLGLLPALGSAVYKGVLLSTNAQPGWRDARWLGGYLANSALLLGCAELLVLSALMGTERATQILRFSLGLLLLLNALILLLLLVDLRPVLARAYTTNQIRNLVIFALGGGMLAPLCLVLVSSNFPLLLAAVVLLVLGSWLIRYEIIMIPHHR